MFVHFFLTQLKSKSIEATRFYAYIPKQKKQKLMLESRQLQVFGIVHVQQYIKN